MDEKSFFEYEDVKVTNVRFISGTQMYAMSNITSVKTSEQKPNRIWGVLALLIGLATAINSPVAGAIISVAAGLFLYFQKTTYHVMLATSGGETSALKTYQREYLDKVVHALNQAIVYRG